MLSSYATLVVAVLTLSFASNAVAAEPGQISGTVTDAKTKAPIEGIEVCAYPPNVEDVGPETFGCTTTGAGGEYTIDSLAGGEYIVEFSVPVGSQLNYVTQYYDGRSSESSAEHVTVTASNTTLGVNAQLTKGGQVAGRVTDARTSAPIGGILVCASQRGTDEGGGCSTTSPNGEYTISRLTAGLYVVVFAPPFGARPNYITQYYNGQASSFIANQVSVKAEEVTPAINAALNAGAQISGSVTDGATGAAMRGVLVCAFSTIPEVKECAVSNEVGRYLIEGLPSADYQVGFSAGKGYLVQYYNAKYSRLEAQVIPLFAGELATGINASMQTGPASLPINSGVPVLSGKPTVGDSLTCSPGSWTGKPPPTFAYQWQLDGSPIEGATEGTYTAGRSDIGHSLSCQVTATNVVGTASATSVGVRVRPAESEKPLVTILGRRLVVKGRSVGVRLQCAHARCRGRLELSLARRVGKRHVKVAVAVGSFSIARGERRVVTMRLVGKRTAVVSAGKRPLAMRLSASVQGGSMVGKTVLVS